MAPRSKRLPAAVAGTFPTWTPPVLAEAYRRQESSVSKKTGAVSVIRHDVLKTLIFAPCMKSVWREMSKRRKRHAPDSKSPWQLEVCFAIDHAFAVKGRFHNELRSRSDEEERFTRLAKALNACAVQLRQSPFDFPIHELLSEADQTAITIQDSKQTQGENHGPVYRQRHLTRLSTKLKDIASTASTLAVSAKTRPRANTRSNSQADPRLFVRLLEPELKSLFGMSLYGVLAAIASSLYKKNIEREQVKSWLKKRG